MKISTVRFWLSFVMALLSCGLVIFLNQSNLWDLEHSHNHSDVVLSEATRWLIKFQYVMLGVPLLPIALNFILRKMNPVLRLLPELLYIFACAWMLYAMFVWQVQLRVIYFHN